MTNLIPNNSRQRDEPRENYRQEDLKTPSRVNNQSKGPNRITDSSELEIMQKYSQLQKVK